ncbi:MAG: carbohydrate kinase family protein [Dehalococcoidia bacterium]
MTPANTIMQIFVSGSLAYDRIMDFPGRFSDHIMPDKLHILNVSFTVEGLVERPGGTAGNIAYALSLLGEKPTIMATIGRDYQRYFQWLEKHDVPCDGIRIIQDEVTASAYITTDRADNQITAFNPGAMKHPSRFDLDTAEPGNSIGIVAPGNLEDMMAYTRAYQARGINYIFDPGQSIPAWDGKQMSECISGAAMLVSNDYELGMVMERTSLGKEDLLQRTGAVVTTKGEHGSIITTLGGDVLVPAISRPETLVDPTGAGDAYRGGLIKGLIDGKSLVDSARLGTVCASFAIECQGTQEYTFTLEQFNARLREAFGQGV